MADIKREMPKLNKDKYHDSSVINLRTREVTNVLSKEEIRARVQRHKRIVIARIIIIGILLIIAGLAVNYYHNNKSYSGFDVVGSMARDDTATAEYDTYLEGYVRYSNDGLSYFNRSGKEIWNKTYTMQKPRVKACEKMLVVADINGRSIYIFDDKGNSNLVETSMNISQVDIAKQGVVAVALEDSNANYINLYNKEGDILYSIKTSLTGDGYPIDIALSSDAKKLVASYVHVQGNTIKSDTVFYNFSDVGENKTERVVGGFDNKEQIVGDVFFMDDETVACVGERVLNIYRIKEYPQLQKSIEIKNDIDRVFFNKDYIGLVEKNSESADNYRLVAYNKAGSITVNKTFNTYYNSIQFDENGIVMSTDQNITLLNMRGKRLAGIDMNLGIEKLLATGSRGKYICINSKYVQSIKLK